MDNDDPVPSSSQRRTHITPEGSTQGSTHTTLDVLIPTYTQRSTHNIPDMPNETKIRIKRDISKMSKYLSRGDQDKAHDVLARLQEKDDPDYLRGLFYQYRDKKNKSSEKKDKNREKKDKSVTDLTILHIAATFEKGNLKIVTYLLTEIPSLLYIPREDSYNGQTALHIAVARGNYEIAEAILEKDKSLRKKEPFFFNKEPIHERLADGFRFKNTIVMGQTPLSVAALKGDKRMVDLLIEISHADICQKNTLNETIFHSIIRYAAVHPERETDMQVMCDHLNNKLQVKYSHGHPIWFERNQNNLTALQLAASLGTVNMFGFIVNLKDIYCFQAAHDGLFDIKKYDITEIDSVTWRKAVTLEEESRQENSIKSHTVENVNQTNDGKVAYKCIQCVFPETESILEMMCNSIAKEDRTYVQKLVEIVPVKNIIRLKWDKYKWFHYVWMIIHTVFLSFLTYHSVIREEFYEAKRRSSYVPNVQDFSKTFVDVCQILGFLFSFIYLFVVITVFIVKTKKPPKSIFMKYSNNFWYLSLLLCFSLCFIIDSSIHWLGQEKLTMSGFLIAALIFGWWFLVFFLRAIYHFSFFTELIGRFIFGDLFRFSVVIGFELIAFTAGMSIMFTGRTVEEITSNGTSTTIPDNNFAGYSNTLLTMFKLMLGLGDIDILYEAKSPGIAIALFIFFVILTYLLMINALIAMMSVTCTGVLEGRFSHWRMQQLSSMLFLEEMSFILCLSNRLPCLGVPLHKKLRSYTNTKNMKSPRFVLEIHALQIDLASTEDKDALMKTKDREENPAIVIEQQTDPEETNMSRISIT